MLQTLGQRRQEVLTLLLENRPGLTVDSIARMIGITKTAIHQHIISLERDGYIEKHLLTKTGGRPGRAYILTGKGIHLFPKQYAWFSELLIERLREKLGSEELDLFMFDFGKSLADDLKNRVEGMSAMAQIEEVVRIMGEFGYEAFIEETSSNELATICARNCIFHDIAKRHPEVCTLDIALLSSLTGKQVEQVECMVRGGQGCRFKFSHLAS